MPKMPTILDVAQESGYSINTVSRALNGMPGVSRETRAKVVAAAELLGYTPNRLAASLHARSSRMLGLIVTDCTNPFYAGLIRAIEDTAAAEGFGVILCNSSEEDEREARAIRLLLESRVDGLLITPAQGTSDNVRLLKSKSIPFVLLGRRFAGLDTNYVTTDNESGAYHATSYLVELGHRRIAHLTGRRGISSVAERAAGFSRALHDHGVAMGVLVDGLERGVEAGIEAARGLLAGRDRPTAVFAYNDMVALGVIHAARQLGLQVPRDVSVIGFDNIQLAAYLEVPLTTVAQPVPEIGRQGTVALLRLLDGTEPSGIERLLEPHLIVRASTAVRPAETT